MVATFNEPRYEIQASGFRCTGCKDEIPCDTSYTSSVFYEASGFQRRDYCSACWRKILETQVDASHPATLAVDGTEVFAYWKTKRPPLPSDEPRKIRFDSELVYEFFLRLGREGDGPDAPAAPAVLPVATEPPVEAPFANEASAPAEPFAPAEAPPPTGEGGEPRARDDAPELTPTEGMPATSSGTPPPAQPSDEEREELRLVLALLLVRKKMLTFQSSLTRNGIEWLRLREKKDTSRTHWVKNPVLSDARMEGIKDRIGELLQMRL